MNSFNRAMSISGAAWFETMREHRAELDIEHLLLGLLGAGGGPAQTLAAHGVTLARARRAVTAVRAERLGDIGIDPTTVPVRDVRDMAGLTAREVGDLPMSRAAREVLSQGPGWNPFSSGERRRRRRLRGADFETGILRDLLAEPSGRIAAIIEHCGASVAALRADATGGPVSGAGRGGVRRASPGVPRSARVLPGWWPGGEPAAAIAQSHFVSADPARVRAVLEDPEQIRRIVGGGGVFRVDRQPDPLGAIAWTVAFSGEEVDGKVPGPADQVTGYERFELMPVPGGTVVLYETARRTYGRTARLWALVARYSLRFAPRHRLLLLSDACARGEDE